jgi:acetyl/propionyl-CoA carboxylase alpha subunit
VPLEYDPLLAKLIAYGEDRKQTIARLRRALSEYFIAGVTTNLGLFRRILDDPDFVSGKTDTGLLTRLTVAAHNQTSSDARLATIAAGVFTALNAPNGNPAGRNGSGRDLPQQSWQASPWKKVARSEGLG